MSQLHSLFKTLNEREINLIRSQRLIGKEKEVFDYIIDHTAISLPDTDTVLQELDITDSHFYKIHSVLVRKCYEWLVPEQGMELLLFLKRKNLFNLLRHEILTQEKKLKTEKNKKSRETFYLKCFHLLIDFPYKFYDDKLTDLFGEKYLKAKEKATESDTLYIKFHKLFSEINRNAARKNPLKSITISIEELFEEEKNLAKTDHHLAKYYLYRSICSYFTYYKKDDKKVLEYLKKAIALKKEIAYFFSIDIGQFLDLLYADTLFLCNKIDESYALYSKIFEKGVSEDMYGYHYHNEQYCLVLIIKKKFEKALEILNRVFKPCIDNKMDIYATRGAMAYTKLFLSNGDLKQALRYLNISKTINEKTFYLPFDIQIRVLETIYFIQKKDFEFAGQLAVKNIKFLKSQHQDKIFANYLLFWKAVQLAINQQFKKTKGDFPKQELDLFDECYRHLYCELIAEISKQLKENTIRPTR